MSKDNWSDEKIKCAKRKNSPREKIVYPDRFNKQTDNNFIEPLERMSVFVSIDELRVLSAYRSGSVQNKELMDLIVNVVLKENGN